MSNNFKKIITLHGNCKLCRYCFYRMEPVLQANFLYNLRILKEGPYILKKTKGSYYSVAYHQEEEISICNADYKMYPYNKYNYNIHDPEANNQNDEEVFVILTDTLIEQPHETTTKIESLSDNVINEIIVTELTIYDESDKSNNESDDSSNEETRTTTSTETIVNSETKSKNVEGIGDRSDSEAIMIEKTIAIREGTMIRFKLANRMKKQNVIDSTVEEISSDDIILNITDESISSLTDVDTDDE